ncbi:MAG: COX15/CtaA family protein [Anaerolinea sp.]|nr:COX15/CtaA family protein [Anaerolinea sp.]
MTKRRYTTFAWVVVAYTIAVILWGAFVRATGAGAGCGSHWPTCNGQIIPRPEQVETIIEFSHRITSMINGFLVIGLLWGAFRLFPKGHIVRRGAALSLLFIIIEGLLGAALVRFDWVVDNVSLGRVVASGVHLINTSILMTFIILTAWWSGGGRPLRWRDQGQVGWLLLVAFVGYLILSASGAITALGNTVFPSESFAAGFAADFDPTSHFVIRLRVWHPVIAIALGIYLVLMSTAVAMQRPSPQINQYAHALKIIFGAQLLLGFLNVLLLAPVWMQLAHLLLANLILIFQVLLSAEALSQPQPAADPSRLAAQTG